MEGNTAQSYNNDVEFQQHKYCINNITGGQNVEKLCLVIIQVHKNLRVAT